MATAATKDKVLVFGSNAGGSTGSLKALLTKITGINSKHGPFSCVICLGDMFPVDQDDTDADVGALIDGSLAVPVSTYCMLGSRALPKRIAAKAEASNGEICDNLFFLGKQTVLTLSSGLKIAAFGGAFDLEAFTSSSVSPSTPTFTSASLDSFVASPSLSNTDILLTHAWPSQITRFSEKPIPSASADNTGEQDAGNPATWGVPALQKIFAKAKPKYAFVSDKNVFWEREPFVYPATHTYAEDAPASEVATRFISLGQFNNTTKQRQFYAFSITPTSATASGSSSDLPANVTPCPFQIQQAGSSSSKGANKRSLPEDDFDDGGNSYIFAGTNRSSEAKKGRHGEPPQGYKCKICNVPGHFIQDCPEKVDQPPAAKKAANGAPPPESYTCRLCNIGGHWIQDCPLAGQQSADHKPRQGGPPKEIGPDECWFCLSNPKVTKHLIASIGAETYLTLPKGQLLDTSDPESLVPGGGHVLIIPIAHYPTLSSVPEEMAGPLQAEIDAYKRALRSCYEQYGAKMISWEISRTAGAKSAHAHIQVCPLPPAAADRAQSTFEEEGGKANYDFTTDPAQVSRVLQSGNYFRLDLPDGTKMVHAIRPGDRFNLQFGRTTIAQLLDRPTRADWKTCAKSDDDEGKDKKNFAQAFSKYDPSG